MATRIIRAFFKFFILRPSPLSLSNAEGLGAVILLHDSHIVLQGRCNIIDAPATL